MLSSSSPRSPWLFPAWSCVIVGYGSNFRDGWLLSLGYSHSLLDWLSGLRLWGLALRWILCGVNRRRLSRVCYNKEYALILLPWPEEGTNSCDSSTAVVTTTAPLRHSLTTQPAAHPWSPQKRRDVSVHSLALWIVRLMLSSLLFLVLSVCILTPSCLSV